MAVSVLRITSYGTVSDKCEDITVKKGATTHLRGQSHKMHCYTKLKMESSPHEPFERSKNYRLK